MRTIVSTLALVLLLTATVFAPSCRSTTSYRPSREIVSSIPKNTAAQGLSRQFEDAFPHQRGDPGPLPEVDADGVHGLFDDFWHDRRTERWAWSDLTYEAIHNSELDRYRLRLHSPNDRWFTVHWKVDEETLPREKCVESLETCIDALESLGVKREPD